MPSVAKASAFAQCVGVNLERLRKASAEAFALDDHGGERLDVFDTGTLDELIEGLGSLLSGADLHDYGGELACEFRINVLHLFAHAKHGLIECESGA